MKKIILTVVCLAIALALGGCGASQDSVSASPTAVPTAEPASEPTAPPAVEPTAQPVSISEIDLTKMNSAMVYSYVYSMLNEQDQYMGSRFRIAGQYSESYSEALGVTYHFVIIADATACCAQGMEFILADANASYPKEGDEIEISGVFGRYLEEGSAYCYIDTDEIKIL